MFSSAEERVDRLEVVLEQFISQSNARAAEVNTALLRLERMMEQDRREHNKRWGELANKMGTLVEDIVAPNLLRMSQGELNCGEFQHFAIRLERVHPITKQEREFDVVVAGSESVLLNQTKSSPTPEHAQAFADFARSGEFFEYFPEYRGRALLPVFSSLYIPANVITYLTKQGIYAVAMGGDTMQVVNLQEVKGMK